MQAVVCIYINTFLLKVCLHSRHQTAVLALFKFDRAATRTVGSQKLLWRQASSARILKMSPAKLLCLNFALSKFCKTFYYVVHYAESYVPGQQLVFECSVCLVPTMSQ